jgi:hypothetical protein
VNTTASGPDSLRLVRSYALALFLMAQGRRPTGAAILPPGIAAFRFNDDEVVRFLPMYRAAKAELEALEMAAREARA